MRAELERLVSLANTAERPKPTAINPPDHAMPGHEWTVTEQHPHTTRVHAWVIRTVDDPECANTVYVSTPDSTNPGDDFGCMSPIDARRVAMALIAAADRAEHVTARVTRLEDRRAQ
ncbi:hypothetical protein [Streptomyces phytophilus]|uniref:hypothetical protein n=1 Tax=Streptomyces phytophilus TaxID=722715 RepID=UPI0015F1009C|nr:hypothetical protein [Streptomyces phytophilus]